jgi:3-hydroxybutyryl-CoA dehydrogenase
MPVPAVVGVIGGGRMGAGIAQVFALAGSRVIVVERDDAAAGACRSRLADGLAKAAAHSDHPLDVTEITTRLTVGTDYTALRVAGLVIEAVPEEFDLKIDALTRAEAALDDTAWLTSNTSSLSVSDLAASLARPGRFCGLHFFNPVPPSALVEVVLTAGTDPELARLAPEWVTSLGKTPIVVHDAPGFASSRLGLAIALEAMRMFEEGVASAADIDTAMVLGYRHATGPLRTSDLVGLDVRLGIAEYLASTLGERFAPPQILRDKVARGELGRKTGKGFFDYA